MPERRFAITATDRYLGVFKAFVEAGWQPVKLFTAPTDERISHNKATIAYARSLGLDIQLSPLDQAAMVDLQARDCELLVLASYQWRIGDWAPYLRYAINFHPSPLPRYRGPYPLVQALLDRQKRWAVSCHQVTHEFDAGAVLASRSFELSDDECHESLDLKTQIAAGQLATAVAMNLDALWDQAQPQGEGHYVKLWSDADRLLDFERGVDELQTQLRAFGRFECLARVNNVVFHVRRAAAWKQGHRFPPGAVVHSDGPRLVLACSDGYVALLEWSLLAPGTPTETPAR